ncbi:hypothetical protein HPG69_004570 [Diceros bicornis minor]|uniref:Phospholipase A2 n=1 Tax=Diceros bicornis minor TaxID=77932 RepID=A0A7J7F9X0_DICBM|nr:hypothetical protein HPG69_004570 [Diceros bicornis minor]
MKDLLTLALFLACSVPAVPGSLLELNSMIEKVTGKTALMDYGFYGCYCGFGDHTHQDGLCPFHSGSKSLLLTGAVGCMTVAMGSWRRKAATSGHSHTDTDSHGAWSPVLGPLCQQQLCTCDQKLVYCLKRNLWSYNPLYRYFPNILCI